MDINLTKEQQLILLGIIASIVIGLCVTAYQKIFPQANSPLVIEEAKSPAAVIYAQISGAVKCEGMYRLKKGDRLVDALNLAGGAASTADLSAVNLAEELKDGQKVIIPRRTIEEEEPRTVPGKRQSSSSAKKINLNTANASQLDSLPGIGKATASKIIEYRRNKGQISKIEQLLEIPRFGKSRLDKLKDKIVL